MTADIKCGEVGEITISSLDSYKFKLVYTEYPLEKVKDEYVKNGGEAWHLMEGIVTSLDILNRNCRPFWNVRVLRDFESIRKYSDWNDLSSIQIFLLREALRN